MARQPRLVASTPFVPVRQWLKATIDPNWLLGTHELWIGLRSTEPLPQYHRGRELYDIRVGAGPEVSLIGEQATDRLLALHVADAPIPGADYSYYRLEQHGPTRDRVRDSGFVALAIRPHAVNLTWDQTNGMLNEWRILRAKMRWEKKDWWPPPLTREEWDQVLDGWNTRCTEGTWELLWDEHTRTVQLCEGLWMFVWLNGLPYLLSNDPTWVLHTYRGRRIDLAFELLLLADVD